MSRLKEVYQNEIVDAMIKKFGYKNIMEVPKIDKVVINMGVGEAKDNAKLLESAVKDMETITGQKAVRKKAAHLLQISPIGCNCIRTCMLHAIQVINVILNLCFHTQSPSIPSTKCNLFRLLFAFIYYIIITISAKIKHNFFTFFQYL